MGMLEDDLQIPDKQCEHCGSVLHWSGYCPKRKPLDTSTLGAVKYDPVSRAAQAKQVREALSKIAEISENANWSMWRDLAACESDEVLLKLKGYLK